MNNDAPASYYTAFIDEAGDPGLNTVRPIDAVGGSEWLCLGAVVIRAAHDADVAEWVSSIQAKAGIRGKPDLHYRNLPEFRKRIVCSELAKLPIRAFVLASNKKNMRQYRNQRAERVKSQQWCYNYCLRLLLERVTHFCYEQAKSDNARNRLLKIIYSKRGGHSYGQTTAYHELLKNQSKAGALTLTKRRIFWEVLDWRLAEAATHKSSEGAQLADVVASSFYQAIDTLPPTKWNNEFAKLLKPVVAREDGHYFNYGFALQPTPATPALLLRLPQRHVELENRLLFFTPKQRRQFLAILTNCPGCAMVRIYPRHVILVQPDDKTPGPCLQACQLAPITHRRGGRFVFQSDFP